MPLWDFIEQYILPLFGTVPPEALEYLQLLFWLAIGVVVIHFLVCLPYRGILTLMRVRKWRK